MRLNVGGLPCRIASGQSTTRECGGRVGMRDNGHSPIKEDGCG